MCPRDGGRNRAKFSSPVRVSNTKHQDVLPQAQHSEIGGKMKGKVAQRQESSSFLGEGERGVLIVFLSNS